MKTIVLPLIMVFLFSTATLETTRADGYYFCRPDFPAAIWEKNSKDVSSALTLAAWVDGSGNKKQAIQVFIRNTSGDAEYLQDGRTDDHGIQLFYNDFKGSEILLRGSVTESPNLNTQPAPRIESGGILAVMISVSPKEFGILESHKVTTVLYISKQEHPIVGYGDKIETGPLLIYIEPLDHPD